MLHFATHVLGMRIEIIPALPNPEGSDHFKFTHGLSEEQQKTSCILGWLNNRHYTMTKPMQETVQLRPALDPGRPLLYRSGGKRQHRVQETGGGGLGQRSPSTDKRRGRRGTLTSDKTRHQSQKKKGARSRGSSQEKTRTPERRVKARLDMDSPRTPPQQRGSSSVTGPGHSSPQGPALKSSKKRARGVVSGSPVVHTLGHKQRFVLDADADEAVEDERFFMESMSLAHIKQRCFGTCYVARSPLLMQKMSDVSTGTRPPEPNMNGLMAAKPLHPGTVVAILSHGAVKEASNVNTVCLGKDRYQKYECPQQRVARIRALEQGQQTPSHQTSLETELAFAGAVANEADSQDLLNAVIVTLPAVPAGQYRRKECTVLITSKAVPKEGELLVDYGDDIDLCWPHRQ